MSTYTLIQARQMLDFYFEAEQRVLSGKSISKDGRTWTRENLNEIRRGRQEWQQIHQQLNRADGTKGPALAYFDR